MLKAPAPDARPKAFILRNFLPPDFDSLLKIDGECFPPGIAYSREEMAAFIHHPGSQTWVADANGEVAGFIIASKVSTRRLHIVTLDVVHAWRRRGVGRALLLAAEQLAIEEARKMISLETAEDNVSAQAFYAQLGFRKIRRIESYYSDGTAAFLMVKNLA